MGEIYTQLFHLDESCLYSSALIIPKSASSVVFHWLDSLKNICLFLSFINKVKQVYRFICYIDVKYA